MEHDDILERLHHANDSPWASQSFCQPKKTMDICFLTNFWKVNKQTERKPFPLPRIMEALQKIERFKSATALDLSQGYYHIPLTKNAQKICTTIAMGKILLQEITNGSSIGTRHFSVSNDRNVLRSGLRTRLY